MEIDVRKLPETIRFADGGRNENNVYIQDYDGFRLAVIRDGDGKEAEIEAENIGNLIKALEQVKEYFGDGPGEEDGPWADGWEKRVTGKEEARDIAYASMIVNARDFEEVPPVKFRTGYSWYQDGWIRHDGGGCPVHPMDVVEISIDGETDCMDACVYYWGKDVDCAIDCYRPIRDEDGVPYCSDEGLEPWAEYVATNRKGIASQFSICPYSYDGLGDWSPGFHFVNRADLAPRRYSNTSQHWTETLRRVWRENG